MKELLKKLEGKKTHLSNAAFAIVILLWGFEILPTDAAIVLGGLTEAGKTLGLRLALNKKGK